MRLAACNAIGISWGGGGEGRPINAAIIARPSLSCYSILFALYIRDFGRRRNCAGVCDANGWSSIVADGVVDVVVAAVAKE